MRYKSVTLLLAASLAFGAATPALVGCAGTSASDEAPVAATADGAAESASSDGAASLEDGSYEIEVETDSSMFRADHCTLEVADGAYLAHLTLPGEGFSRLYFGSADDAANAPDDEIYDYYLNDEGLYTFDVPVEALDQELSVAAYGQRRDTWYDHTILFSSDVA